jgi:hypothetical protein
MVGTRTMAALAALTGRASLLVQRCFPVWRFLPAIVNLSVTRLTGVRSHVLGRFRGGGTGRGCVTGLTALSRRWRTALAQRKGEARKDK